MTFFVNLLTCKIPLDNYRANKHSDYIFQRKVQTAGLQRGAEAKRELQGVQIKTIEKATK